MSAVGGVGTEGVGWGKVQGVPPTALQAVIRAAQVPDDAADPVSAPATGGASASDPAAGAARALDVTA